MHDKNNGNTRVAKRSINKKVVVWTESWGNDEFESERRNILLRAGYVDAPGVTG